MEKDNSKKQEPNGLIPARFFALYGVQHSILDLGPILAVKKSKTLVLPETVIPFFEVPEIDGVALENHFCSGVVR